MNAEQNTNTNTGPNIGFSLGTEFSLVRMTTEDMLEAVA